MSDLLNPASPADEVAQLLDAVRPLVDGFIRQAETSSAVRSSAPNDFSASNGDSTNSDFRGKVVDLLPPQQLADRISTSLDLSEKGCGVDGLVNIVRDVLKYSVNTWDQGFMDKLYAGTNAVGVVAELILGVLNTNVHVYQVSPVLTLVEKTVTRALCDLFGFPPESGGFSQPGGSASNASSIVVARNHLYPETKKSGLGGRKFTLFTSQHGHYSLEKAAQMFGFGSSAVIGVPVDQEGRMIPIELDRLVGESKGRGETPFYVNATAGTTVLGSFDPFEEISGVCKKHGLWLHIDGSWGGPVIFDSEIAKTRLKGAHLVDSVGFTPHKMLAVPMTCSFLLVRNLRWAWEAMTLPAGYLFHTNPDEEIYDLADLTPQCGRRGDALKLFLSWRYYGTSGMRRIIRTGYERADYLLGKIKASPNLQLASPEPLPCLQVCFYLAPGGKPGNAMQNGQRTKAVVERLVPRGFMVDFAPGPSGEFFRVVVHAMTLPLAIDNLIAAIEELGEEVVAEESSKGQVGVSDNFETVQHSDSGAS